jgi:hypothetical protein
MTNPTRTNHEYESSKDEKIDGAELRSLKIGDHIALELECGALLDFDLIHRLTGIPLILETATNHRLAELRSAVVRVELRSCGVHAHGPGDTIQIPKVDEYKYQMVCQFQNYHYQHQSKAIQV